jgi:GAF domain-containing protein
MDQDPGPTAKRAVTLGGAVLDDEALDALLQRVVPLTVDSRGPIGALNVYAAENGGFGEDETGVASMLGGHAAILVDKGIALMSATQLNEQLRRAVASREIIGEAKGILMERQNCTRDLAEELVVRVEARKREGTGQ